MPIADLSLHLLFVVQIIYLMRSFIINHKMILLPFAIQDKSSLYLLLLFLSSSSLISEHLHFSVLCLSLLIEYHLVSGIGLETTILFAREGADILMADISEPALAIALAKVDEILPDHPRIQICKCDVSKESEVAAMVDRLDSWGGVDIMFNNAGIMHANDADAINTPEKIWDLTQAINVKGVWFGSKHAVLSLRKHEKTKGSIINTASVVALIGSATPQLAYTASKGAVLAMTRELAIVHAKEGFRFNSLCPAPLK